MEKQALAVREQQWYQTIITAKESGQISEIIRGIRNAE